MQQFPKSIRAAKAVSTDEKALAAAIFEEIPPRSKGRTPAGTATIDDLLSDLAIDLAAAGFHYSIDTLVFYRELAAWAAKGNTPPQGGISWLPVSWSVHKEAYQGGLTWAAFIKHVEDGVKTVDDLRRATNKKPTRKNQPSEKLAEANALLAAGQATQQEQEALASNLSAEALLKETRKRRKAEIEQQVIDGQDDMTDEEIEEVDAGLEGLSITSQALAGAGEDLINDFTAVKSPALVKMGEAEDKLVTASIFQRKHGVNHAEDDEFEAKFDNIARLCDLLRMARSGDNISPADQQWLADHGVAI